MKTKFYFLLSVMTLLTGLEASAVTCEIMIPRDDKVEGTDGIGIPIKMVPRTDYPSVLKGELMTQKAIIKLELENAFASRAPGGWMQLRISVTRDDKDGDIGFVTWQGLKLDTIHGLALVDGPGAKQIQAHVGLVKSGGIGIGMHYGAHCNF